MMAGKKNLSIEEVAEWLGVDARTVYRLAKSGRLPGFKVGRQWRFNEDALKDWIADQTTVEKLKAEDLKGTHADELGTDP